MILGDGDWGMVRSGEQNTLNAIQAFIKGPHKAPSPLPSRRITKETCHRIRALLTMRATLSLDLQPPQLKYISVVYKSLVSDICYSGPQRTKTTKLPTSLEMQIQPVLIHILHIVQVKSRYILWLPQEHKLYQRDYRCLLSYSQALNLLSLCRELINYTAIQSNLKRRSPGSLILAIKTLLF